jgi:hypothetical protein
LSALLSLLVSSKASRALSLLPVDAGRQSSEESVVVGAQEVLIYLLFEAHVPDHLADLLSLLVGQ